MKNIKTYNSFQVDDTEGHKRMMLETFGKNIKNLRLKRRLTQEQLSEMAQINSKYLSEIERGKKNPTALIIYRLSQSLGVSVSEILSTDDCPPISRELFKSVERLFVGKRKRDIQKVIKILEVFFE